MIFSLFLGVGRGAGANPYPYPSDVAYADALFWVVCCFQRRQNPLYLSGEPGAGMGKIMTFLAKESIVQAKPHVVTCPIGDALAVLDVERGQYFTMNSVASLVWVRLEQPSSVKQLVDDVRQKFNTGSVNVEADVIGLLHTFRHHDFIELHDD